MKLSIFLSLFITIFFSACSNYQAPSPYYSEFKKNNNYNGPSMEYSSQSAYKYKNTVPKTSYNVYKYDGVEKYNGNRGYEKFSRDTVDNAFPQGRWDLQDNVKRPYEKTNKMSGDMK